MKAYLAAPIFTERDRNFNSYLEAEILKRCPDLDLYLAQNNHSINNKTGCATSADIYVGDVTKLKEADIVITIMSGDLPPIGSSYEVAYFCALCERDPRKRIIALYDDSREGYHTYSEAKRDAMISGIAECQWSYINLLSVGYVKKWGHIYRTSEELIDAVEREYKIGTDKIISGIYKVTNLKNGMAYIGQSVDIYQRWFAYKSIGNKKVGGGQGDIMNDIREIGLDYFKFEILERCDANQLDEREKYWISYYDTMNNGYNLCSGGNSNKSDMVNTQCVEVFSYDLDGNFVEKFNSINQAKRAVGLASSADISRCIAFGDCHHQTGGRMWRATFHERLEPYTKPKSKNSKEVYGYDMKTRLYINSYESATAAEREIYGSRTGKISAVATGERVSYMGMIWAYDKYDRLPDDYFKTLKGGKTP